MEPNGIDTETPVTQEPTVEADLPDAVIDPPE